jgi:hypothetical protein
MLILLQVIWGGDRWRDVKAGLGARPFFSTAGITKNNQNRLITGQVLC